MQLLVKDVLNILFINTTSEDIFASNDVVKIIIKLALSKGGGIAFDVNSEKLFKTVITVMLHCYLHWMF
jgi:hypothetical protein